MYCPSQFACFLFNCVFIDFPYDEITFVEILVFDLSVVVSSRELLVASYPDQGVISLFHQSVKIVQEHIMVEFGVLCHHGSS